ncbi:RNA-splicing factor [Pleosporales sp. CAS-2024a]
MGGDLNLKKSWHPHLRKNQERVWKEEKSALEERKQIEKLRKEREEERQIEELQKLQEASGGKVVTKRVDWMYAGPSGDGAAVTEEREGYLLGKRRIDNLLKSDTTNLQKGAAVSVDAVGTDNLNAPRDTHKKVLQDPLLMIQKQKMEMQLKAIKDAQKQAKYEKRSKEKERDRKHRDKERHRDRSRDREHKHRSRRDRSRSRSDEHDDRDRRERRHHKHHRDARDERDSRRRRSRSRSPYRKSHRDQNRQRSRSPRRRDDRDDGQDRDSYRRRDRTPPRRSFEKSRRSPDADGTYRPRHSPPATKQEPKESAAHRLAAMQSAASTLEEERAERVRLQEIKDAEEEAKIKQNQDGGRRFINNLRGQASNMDLGEAIARGRFNHRAELDV